MAKEIFLKVVTRKTTGRKVKKLRSQGKLPGNIYGKKVKSLAVELGVEEFKKAYSEAGETNIVGLVVEGEKKPRPVLIANFQKDSVFDSPLHVDFHQVDMTEKVMVSVPVVVIGESPAVKEKGGVLITLLNEIKVEALPADLPDEFKVNVSNLRELNDSIVVKDLNVNTQKVKLDVEMDEVVVTIKAPTEEEVAPVEEVAAAETTEAETTQEEPKAEPEAKAEHPKEEK